MSVNETTFKDDKILDDKNYRYDEFELRQIIATIKIGQTLQIRLLDDNNNEISRKEYTAKYINCHVNFVIQDKGIKKEVTL